MDTLLSLSNDLAGAVERTAPVIVTVHARRRLPSTGIHWRPGVIVTADHTVRAEEDITVTTPDGRSLPAVLAGRDPGTDLAVLTVKDAGSATAALGDDAALKVGHLVLALGYGPRVSWGVIGALGPRWRSWRGGEIERLVRLDLTLYPGFSGGPLVDAAGRVVGLNTSGLARDARLAVPATTVTRVADELLRTGHVSRGYLGLGMQPVPLPEPLRRQLGLTRETGLIVVTVMSSSALTVWSAVTMTPGRQWMPVDGSRRRACTVTMAGAVRSTAPARSFESESSVSIEVLLMR